MTTQQEDQDQLTQIFGVRVPVVGQNPAMINFSVPPNTYITQKQLEQTRRLDYVLVQINMVLNVSGMSDHLHIHLHKIQSYEKSLF